MKNAAIFKIIMYSVTAILLCCVLVFGIVTDGTNIFDGLIYSFEEDDEDNSGFTSSDSDAAVFPSSIEKIEVEWIGGDVIITNGSTKNIEAKESSDYGITDSNRMTYSTSGSTLKIRFCKSTKTNMKINNIKSKTLTLTLPEKLFNEIEIDTVSANVDMSNIKAKKIDVETVSGRAEMKNITVDEIEFSSVSGDANIDGNINRSGDFSNVSGCVTVTLPVSAGWTADLDTMSGKFSTDFAVNTINKSSYVAGSGDISLNFDSVSGDARVKCKSK